MRDTDHYHGKLTCEATKASHEATQFSIRANPVRKTCFWLLVFPEGIALDNRTLGGDNTNLTLHWNGLSRDANETAVGEKIHGMCIFWRIAEDGGRQIRSIATIPDVASLF